MRDSEAHLSGEREPLTLLNLYGVVSALFHVEPPGERRWRPGFACWKI